MKTIITFLSLALLLSGCSILPKHDYPQKNTYAFDTPRTAPSTRETLSRHSIQVHPFAIAQEFSGRGFVYRQSDYKYTSDYYNSYVSPPALLITEQSIRWLSESGIANILPLQNKLFSTHQLQSKITELYVDLRDTSKATANISITMTLFASDGKAPLIQKSYSAQREISGRNGEAFARALSEALADILREQEKDIANAMAGQ